MNNSQLAQEIATLKVPILLCLSLFKDFNTRYHDYSDFLSYIDAS
jgi:hypothetical protein